MPKIESYSLFRLHFSKNFWSSVNRSLVPYKYPLTTPEQKEEFLMSLYELIKSDKYAQYSPRENLLWRKYNLANRIVPVFDYPELCVHYYLIRKLEPDIADEDRRVQGTFGGYRTDIGLKYAEAKEIETIKSGANLYYGPDLTYNPLGWFDHWGKFQNLAHNYSEDNFGYAINFDIADFYDSINVNILEDMLRIACSNADIVDWMCDFLHRWNPQKKQTDVGISQDEVGDASRILANFYLHGYDNALAAYCQKLGSRRLRFSDDHIIFAPSREVAHQIVEEAGRLLHRLGLRINGGKVEEFSNKSQFHLYWSFDLFNMVNEKNAEKKEFVERAVIDFLNYPNVPFRKISVIRRLLHCSIEKIRLDLRAGFFAKVLDEEVILSLSESDLYRLYKKSTSSQKVELITYLEELANQTTLNAYHYRLLKLFSRVRHISKVDLRKLIANEKIY
ncbi:MAG: RNA-directed DNA polymerase [bacterium]|nr:RNA-directed DNA polymerase [bacterium]